MLEHRWTMRTEHHLESATIWLTEDEAGWLFSEGAHGFEIGLTAWLRGEPYENHERDRCDLEERRAELSWYGFDEATVERWLQKERELGRSVCYYVFISATEVRQSGLCSCCWSSDYARSSR